MANNLEQSDPAMAKLTREANPAFVQAIARYATGRFCTLTADHINLLQAGQTGIPTGQDHTDATPPSVGEPSLQPTAEPTQADCSSLLQPPAKVPKKMS